MLPASSSIERELFMSIDAQGNICVAEKAEIPWHICLIMQGSFVFP